MADAPPPHERLQPALLDRLTDEEPDKKLEPREARLLSRSRLRQAGLRYMAWLFNATRLEGDSDPTRVPHSPRALANFCLSALSGSTANSLDAPALSPAH